MNINGQELRITPSSFTDAMALQKAIGRAMTGTHLELPSSINEELSPEMFGDIIDTVLHVAISDEVENALFKCAEKALVGKSKVDRDFFENVDNRQHYYPIMMEVIKVNVGPFFKNLASGLKGLIQKKDEGQK